MRSFVYLRAGSLHRSQQRPWQDVIEASEVDLLAGWVTYTPSDPYRNNPQQGPHRVSIPAADILRVEWYDR